MATTYLNASAPLGEKLATIFSSGSFNVTKGTLNDGWTS